MRHSTPPLNHPLRLLRKSRAALPHASARVRLSRRRTEAWTCASRSITINMPETWSNWTRRRPKMAATRTIQVCVVPHQKEFSCDMKNNFFLHFHIFPPQLGPSLSRRGRPQPLDLTSCGNPAVSHLSGQMSQMVASSPLLLALQQQQQQQQLQLQQSPIISAALSAIGNLNNFAVSPAMVASPLAQAAAWQLLVNSLSPSGKCLLIDR